MTQDTPSRSTEPEQEAAPDSPARPPGELGGHTVQPWEQDAVPPTTTPNSKDVPPPEMGTAEARAAGAGAGPGTMAPAEPKRAELPGSEGAEVPGKAIAASQNRPPRPPVYKPQNGHEPAPRPPPAQVVQAKAKGPATGDDALVEAITKAIADNLARALHQSVAQAVRESMALSGRSIAQPKVDVGPNLTTAPPKPKAAAAKPGTPILSKPQEAKPAPKVDPSAQSPLGKPLDEARASQYGGTIEPADEKAKAKLAAAGNPANPAIGQPAQESADRESREGNLA